MYAFDNEHESKMSEKLQQLSCCLLSGQNIWIDNSPKMIHGLQMSRGTLLPLANGKDSEGHGEASSHINYNSYRLRTTIPSVWQDTEEPEFLWTDKGLWTGRVLVKYIPANDMPILLQKLTKKIVWVHPKIYVKMFTATPSVAGKRERKKEKERKKKHNQQGING